MTYRWGINYMMCFLKHYFIIKKHKNAKNEFLVVIWILKMKHWIYNELAHTFKFSYLFKNDEQKNMSCTRTSIIICYKNCKNNYLKNSLVWKNDFLAKINVIFFLNNHVGSLYLICTHWMNKKYKLH
jgi:hypothetical protein